eukprot:6195779-Pleurochrysis_carterae.AAC.5
MAQQGQPSSQIARAMAVRRRRHQRRLASKGAHSEDANAEVGVRSASNRGASFNALPPQAARVAESPRANAT